MKEPKKITFKEINGKIEAVEDPDGKWRLYSMPNGGTFLASPPPDGFTAGIDPYESNPEQ